MSLHKEKGLAPQALRDIHQKIIDLLLKVKPRLSDKKCLEDHAIPDELYQISALAESLVERRPRSSKSWQDLADSLDEEGVTLWNWSGTMQHGRDPNGGTLSAALKYAGYRLIEAGLEHKLNVETLLRMLHLASKVGSALSEAGRRDAAASVLMSAAKYEESLRNAGQLEGEHAQTAATATITYYTTRMDAAFREGNDGVAQFMLQKITENEAQLELLQALDRERVAAKLLEIGKSFLRSKARDVGAVEPESARESVPWMQKAFTMIEHLEDVASPGLPELKRSILRSLARAYFLSSSLEPENLTRAEASLNELITTLDSTTNSGSPEYQQLRWMRIAVLKRRRASELALMDAFQSVVDHTALTDADVTDLLQELRTLHQHHTLVTAIHRHSLKRSLEIEGEHVLNSIDRLLLSLIHHCSKDQDHGRAMGDMAEAFSDLHNGDIKLAKVSTVACLTLLWQFGDRHYHAKRWSQAAEWFLAGAHSIFSSMGTSTEAKCYRKAALALIHGKEYGRAYTAIRHCPTDEAATYYVVFLTAVHQGLEEEAIRAVKDMVNSSDFDRNMLLLATQMAHESELKCLLLTILDALLQTLKDDESIETEIDAITIIRCLVRLILKLLSEPGANRFELVQALIRYLKTAKSCCEKAASRKAGAVISKDVSWLWRAAYNCGVQGCSEWESPPDIVSDLFEATRELLEVYCQMAAMDVDSDVYQYIVNASFASISGRVFMARERLLHGSIPGDRLRPTLKNIEEAKARIQGILGKNLIRRQEDIPRVRSFLHVLRVFQVEMLCHLKDWCTLLETVGEIVRADALAVNTFEAVADILWVEKDCPTEILFTVLEAILHASLDRNMVSVTKFARWLRAICTILLSRNAPADRLKAIGYVEQAVTVLETQEHDESSEIEAYPADERQWLLATTYNTGIECLHASLLDEAKRWFEASTVICRYVPDGEQRAEKISATYTHLLSRYASDS